MTVDLSITVNGMKFDNPFVLGSGPPGTNGKVIARSYDLGWGGMVCKTFSLDASKVINTAPRYAKLRGRDERRGDRLPEHRADQRPSVRATGSTTSRSSRRTTRTRS